MHFTKSLTISATTLLLLGGAAPAVASASTVDLSDQAPSSGSVTLDNNDQVKSASSSTLLAEITKATQNTGKIVVRSVVNMASGRWVYYSDHHGLKNYKWGHSNYYSTKGSHGSKAKVGSSSSGWIYAKAHKYSYSTAKGYGTFKAYYTN
ncbi:hypothetical protein WJM93_15710 [Lactiplantibacillus plantarum]|uniref:hypothetical protein n=2 Tax=Lactiplantibacillus plantarum TaxID=1590 RepID=UPI00309FB7BA|nr:hypothetical protein [Lactiplantibacillus plantarum]